MSLIASHFLILYQLSSKRKKLLHVTYRVAQLTQFTLNNPHTDCYMHSNNFIISSLVFIASATPPNLESSYTFSSAICRLPFTLCVQTTSVRLLQLYVLFSFQRPLAIKCRRSGCVLIWKRHF